MRRFLIIIGVLVLTVSSMSLYGKISNSDSHGAMAQNKCVELYFVDSEMLRLIPNKVYIDSKKSVEKTAKMVIAELIKGKDNNPKILRTIPKIKNGLTVKVKNDTAYVNLSKKFVQAHSDNSIHETLTVYSIVNSLASVEGITKIKFTIDGKSEEHFKGRIDMRETFVPDYMV